MKNILFNDISLAALCKAHLDELAPRLRAADRAEMWAAYRLQAREGLELCLGRSVLAVAFVYRGKAAAAAGVEAQSLLGRRGCVWSWTGESVDGCAKSFFRASRAALDYFLTLYPLLYAACDVRYTAARRYLRRLGAREAGPAFYLAGKETRFVPYVFSRPDGA